MDEWEKTIDALVKAFDEFAVKVKEMVDALAGGIRIWTVSIRKQKKKESQFPGSIWNVSEEISKRIHR